MRLHLKLPTLLAVSSLWAASVAAFVSPQAPILPTYDIREGGAVYDGISPIDDQSTFRLSTEPRLTEPSASQKTGLERLRAHSSPALTASFLPANGLPRQLHAWGAPLTPPSGSDPEPIVRQFLKDNPDLFRLTPSEVDALVVARDYPTGDVFHTLWLAQAVNGVFVDQATIRFNLNDRGQITWVSSGPVEPGLRLTNTLMLSPEEAILAAARHIGVALADAPPLRSAGAAIQRVYEPGIFLSEVVVEPAIFPMGNGQGLQAWRVYLEPQGDIATWYVVTVDAGKGELLRRTNLYRYATNQGLVFNGNYPNTAPNPPYTRGVPQTRQDFGWKPASTTGWTIPAPYGQYNLSVGNNVEAKEDWAGDNEATIGLYADGGPLQEWFAPFTNAYALSPGVTDPARIMDGQVDISSVTTNLFYWNNLWHDYMYHLGFNEAAGNFQMDNFGRGGCGTDSILADAQDNAIPAGGGAPSLNNANFGTPPEPVGCGGAFRPRMQQYMTQWGPKAAPTFLADTSLDADVIIHEFSHGTSHRLVGGPAVGCLDAFQSGAMGEGWGDWYAASYFNDPVMGEYSFADPVAGVRQFPMNANPRTYANMQFQVHADGEIHASILWDIRTRVGGRIAEQLVTDAMKLSPCSPTFPDYRDALIHADILRYGGVHVCDIWHAYHARGIGLDAGAIGGRDPITDFVFLGTECSGWAHPRYDSYTTVDQDGDGLYRLGEVIDLMVRLHNRTGASTATNVRATVASLTPGITMVTATQSYPNIPKGGSALPYAPFQFRVDPAFVCGSVIDFEVAISWGAGLSRKDRFRDGSGSRDGVAFYSHDAEGAPLAVSGSAAVVTTQNHTPGGSKSYHMLAGCYAGGTPGCNGPCANNCSTVTLPAMQLPAGQGTELSFWSTYNNEQGWDGIFVQVSIDGGNSWQFVADATYNGTLAASGGGCGIPAQSAINGPSGNAGLAPWQEFRASLVRYAGQVVMVRIAQHTDACTDFEGAYVDDIRIIAKDCQAGHFVNTFLGGKANNDTIAGGCTDADQFPDPGETVDVSLTVTNTGNSAANGLTGTLSSTSPRITIDPTMRTQNYGNLVPGGSAQRTFRYSVAMLGPVCFEPADFVLDVSANGGGYVAQLGFREILRQDATLGSWFDDMEGGQPAWTPTLGPAGTAQDWALREMDCFTSASNRYFWSTNIMMVNPMVCGSGEPDYSPDSDSVLTSPPINLGAAGSELRSLSWRAVHDAFAANWGNTVLPGFVELSIDHDGDGAYTVIANWANGLNPTNRYSRIDLQNNPAGAVLRAQDTVATVRVRFRFRALGPDPTGGRTADGMIVDEVRVEWAPCDVNACAPGVQGRTVGARGGAVIRSGGSGGSVEAGGGN